MNYCKDCKYQKRDWIAWAFTGEDYSTCWHPSLLMVSPVTGKKEHKPATIKYCENIRGENTECKGFTP